MPVRRSTPARTGPPRRPPTSRGPAPRRGAPQIPWMTLVGGALVLFAVIIVSVILLRAVVNSGQSTPISSATAQSMITPTPGVPATLNPGGTATPAPLPTATPRAPTLIPAIQVTVQRDPDVDPATGIATWTEPAAQSEIRVLLRRANGSPLDKYVSGHHQGADVSGNPVREGNRVFGKWTGDSGMMAAAVPPGAYILDFDVDGWPWTAQFVNHTVATGQRTNILFDISLLTVGLRYADGNPTDKYVRVLLQTADVSGAPVEGASVNGGWTGDNGLVTFEVTPGIYALQISDIDGYDTWGRFDHQVPGGGDYTVVLTLGRLSVETWNTDGTLATDVYVQVYQLVPDSQNLSVFGRSVANGRSGNTGRAVFDLTPGFYGVQIGRDVEFVDVPVQSGQITTVNRSGYVLP